MTGVIGLPLAETARQLSVSTSAVWRIVKARFYGILIKMIKDWAKLYKKELLSMWEEQEFKKLPGLE